MHTDFRIRNRGPITVLAKTTTVTLRNIGAVIGSSFEEAYRSIGASDIAAGEPFIVYHGAPGEGGAKPFEIQICAPVTGAINLPGWELAELPGGTFASVVHLGSYDTLGVTYDELERRIADEGLAIAGPPREVYLSEPATPPEDTRTVVEFPVVVSTSAVPAMA